MSVTVIQGKLGSGKSLLSMQLILDYLNQGRQVACNFPINADLLNNNIRKDSKLTILPTFVNSDMLHNLGFGGKSEHEAGLLVLDECMLLFNSRSWNDKDRQSIVEFFVNTRKLKWDVILIVQDHRVLDKQIRETFVEFVTNCIRLDRIKLPLIPIHLPKLHIGVTRYGTLPHAPVAERKFYMASKSLYQYYDSYTIFKKGDSLSESDVHTFNLSARLTRLDKIRKALNDDPLYYLTYFAHRPLWHLFTWMGRKYA